MDTNNTNVEVEDMSAVECLRKLHELTGGINFLHRSNDWEGEVARFSAHEGVSPEDWEAEATEELRAEVLRLLASV